MRILCDACESAPAIVFCAADEAALCRACDEKVHMCNKLASRHVRVGLANPSDVPRCDICENAPAFFYCEIDGSSLCLQCDMIVHVGGKRTHGRNLLLRQRVEFPGDKPAHIDETRRGQNHPPKTPVREKQQNHKVSPVHGADAAAAAVGHLETDTKMIDLNMKPHRIHGQASNNQEDGPNNQILMQVMYGKHYSCGIPISAY
ncbi:hypothetical protein E1A91_A12G064600v1 [Gossypium mustelinum]|uniref:B-box zinc finger protein 18 isoform X1 n=2 Tax=Gossypium TaxID=3633 RepID=A0ABM2ZB54_GOSHI|nr:B-box zinc finger protein 18 isoform X1 [Gossypium hirsutum]TYJ04007.1 hypothetical protein E1A91_A12G064600v1 [Gossypium mustelinum]